MSDVTELVIDHDGVFPALRPVRVSYFDPATGEPCDHQVGTQVSEAVRPKRAPGGGVAPFNGYPADAGARKRTKRVCARCGKGFLVPRDARNPPRRCPECRRAARLEVDLRRQERQRRQEADRRALADGHVHGRRGRPVPVVAVDRLTGEVVERWGSVLEASEACHRSKGRLSARLLDNGVLVGWRVLFREATAERAWPWPVVVEAEGGGRVAFADRAAVCRAFGIPAHELDGAMRAGGSLEVRGRSLRVGTVVPSPGLADMRRWER